MWPSPHPLKTTTTEQKKIKQTETHINKTNTRKQTKQTTTAQNNKAFQQQQQQQQQQTEKQNNCKTQNTTKQTTNKSEQHNNNNEHQNEQLYDHKTLIFERPITNAFLAGAANFPAPI
jgi:CRISPR/Cas system CSM-associated protein Csm4 (group 5 of RAMP superfamily)